MILTCQHVILPFIPSHYTYYHVEMLESNSLFNVSDCVCDPNSELTDNGGKGFSKTIVFKKYFYTSKVPNFLGCLPSIFLPISQK